jgi:hypothetical protein
MNNGQSIYRNLFTIVAAIPNAIFQAYEQFVFRLRNSQKKKEEVVEKPKKIELKSYREDPM